jgi:hypothetical protein
MLDALMRAWAGRVRGTLGAVVLVALAAAPRADAADGLVWRAAERRVDADLRGWPLARVLDAIVAATGWQVFVEPGVEYTVTAKFEGLKPADALIRLFGDLNFAVIPRPAGPAAAPTRLLVYRRSPSDATAEVRAARRGRDAKPTPIPDELVVSLKRGAKGVADALAKRVGGTIVGRLDGARAYRLRFDDEAAARRARAALANEGDVEAIEANFAIAPPMTLEPLPPIGSLPAAVLTPDVSPSKDAVLVGLIDYAVQADAKSLEGFLQPGVALLGEWQPPGDRITHGTAMAQTILEGVSQALRERGDGSGRVPLSILPIDVYGDAERTTTFDVARGIAEALERHVNVVNLSLSSDTDSPLVRNLVADAARKGVLVFGAAGNEPLDVPTYPAAYPSTIAVTASDGEGGIAPWANHGAFVDAIAPGTSVFQFADRSWLGTGTSVSAGWVSGWAAGHMASGGRAPSPVVKEATIQRWGPSPKR